MARTVLDHPGGILDGTDGERTSPSQDPSLPSSVLQGCLLRKRLSSPEATLRTPQTGPATYLKTVDVVMRRDADYPNRCLCSAGINSLRRHRPQRCPLMQNKVKLTLIHW